MKKILLAAFNGLAVSCFLLTGVQAQTTKQHTEKFKVNSDVAIHVNTSHANVEFKTWDKNEVEVVFTLEAKDKVEEQFKKWKFEATGNASKVEINTTSNFDFNMKDFHFDFDMGDFDFDMDDLHIEIEELNLDNIDVAIAEMMDNLNLDEIPASPFGDNTDFNGDKYRKNPDTYLQKMNNKYDTQVTRREVDQWLEELDEWAEEIEMKAEHSMEIEDMGERIREQTKNIQQSVEKWEQKNEAKIKEMTEKIERQMENMNFEQFEQFEQFNYFDQDKSDVKKSILIKIPKNAKLHLNVRYGEVTLAENLRNINADLNYASLAANTINGANTDISASFAPVYIHHWHNGQLTLNHCKSTIDKVTNIALDAQGADIFIGTLLQSGSIQSAYGDLEIKELGQELKSLKLAIDFGEARVNIPKGAFDLQYEGTPNSSFLLPQKFKVLKDTREGKQRVVQAYNGHRNSGNVFSIKANYGDLILKN